MRFATAGCKPSKSSAPNRPTLAQPQCGLHHTNPGLLREPQALAFLCETELWLQSGARFANLRTPVLKCKSSSRYTALCAVGRQLSQIEARNPGNRDPIRRPQEPHYLKKTKFNLRVSRPRVFSPVNSRASRVLHVPTTWCWCGWHDDVADMMLGMLTMTIVRIWEIV